MANASRAGSSWSRRGLALAAALLTGALGWLLIPVAYAFLPVDLLPVEDNALGEWTAEVWFAFGFLSIGWSAALGVSLMARALRVPAERPLRRQGRRGWARIGLCVLGLAAGTVGSGLVPGAGMAGVDASMQGLLYADAGELLRALVLAATAGAGPTLGLMAAVFAGRRWLGSAGRSNGSALASGGVEVSTRPAATQDPEVPFLPAVA